MVCKKTQNTQNTIWWRWSYRNGDERALHYPPPTKWLSYLKAAQDQVNYANWVRSKVTAANDFGVFCAYRNVVYGTLVQTSSKQCITEAKSTAANPLVIRSRAPVMGSRPQRAQHCLQHLLDQLIFQYLPGIRPGFQRSPSGTSGTRFLQGGVFPNQHRESTRGKLYIN